MQNLYLAFRLVVISNESSHIGMHNFKWRQNGN